MKPTKVEINPPTQDSSSSCSSPALPKTPVKQTSRDDTMLANTLSELLSGPPHAKRSLFNNLEDSDEPDYQDLPQLK